MSAVYLGFLDIQPPADPSWRLKLCSATTGSLIASLPCPGPLKPREGLLLPGATVEWPMAVAIGSSKQVPIEPDDARPIREVKLVSEEGVEYTLRLLLSQSSSQDVEETAYHSTSPYTDVIAIANTGPFRLLESVKNLDEHAHALATFMALDQSVLFLSRLALSETGPGRVQTTNECRDLLYPISPLSAFVRAICRVYLLNDMIGSIRPILAELCDESMAVPLTKSLADQTIIASLAVRLWTAAVDVVTCKMPLPFLIAIEEAFRINFANVLPIPSLVGAFVTSCLISSCVVFAKHDLQIVGISPECLPLLVKVHTAVIEAMIASVDPGGSTSGDLAQLVQGLGNDIRNKATPLFNAMIARCRHIETAAGTDGIQLPSIERVSEPRILDRAAAVLRAAEQKNQPSPSKPPPSVAASDISAVTNRVAPFLQLLTDFKSRAFELKLKHSIHPFHQYHLHHYSFGTHLNPQGPTLEDTSRQTRGA